MKMKLFSLYFFLPLILVNAGLPLSIARWLLFLFPHITGLTLNFVPTTSRFSLIPLASASDRRAGFHLQLPDSHSRHRTVVPRTRIRAQADAWSNDTKTSGAFPSIGHTL